MKITIKDDNRTKVGDLPGGACFKYRGEEWIVGKGENGRYGIRKYDGLVRWFYPSDEVDSPPPKTVRLGSLQFGRCFRKDKKVYLLSRLGGSIHTVDCANPSDGGIETFSLDTQVEPVEVELVVML